MTRRPRMLQLVPKPPIRSLRLVSEATNTEVADDVRNALERIRARIKLINQLIQGIRGDHEQN